MGRHTEGLHTRSWRDLGNKEAEMELRLSGGQGFTSRKEGGVCSRQRAKAQRDSLRVREAKPLRSFIYSQYIYCAPGAVLNHRA